jgi:putative photosynthetic complex assembly protein
LTESSPFFPRAPLIGLFAVVGLSLAVAATGRITNIGATPVAGTVIAARDLRFADGADGSVIVTDARDGTPVEVLTGENGFIRGTLRGLARTRKSEGIGPEDAFRLAAWNDGRLTLDDPATGRHIELEAFGPTNTAVFGRLLTAHGGTQ